MRTVCCLKTLVSLVTTLNHVFRQKKGRKKERTSERCVETNLTDLRLQSIIGPQRKKKMFHSSIKHFRKVSKYRKCDKVGLFFLPSKTRGGAFALWLFSPHKRQKPKQDSIPSSRAAPQSGTSSSLFQPGILQPVWGPTGRPPTLWHQSVRVNWQLKYLEGKQPLRKLRLKPAHIGWLWGEGRGKKKNSRACPQRKYS